jgi:hypothetical protein
MSNLVSFADVLKANGYTDEDLAVLPASTTDALIDLDGDDGD